MTTWYSFSLFVHLVALALWLGGMVFFLVVLGPAVRGSEPGLALVSLNQARLGLETASWIGIGLLVLTGVLNLIARAPGAVTPSASYGILLAIKLLVFAAMVAHHCLQVFRYASKIAGVTSSLPRTLAFWPEPLLSLWRRWFLLLKINAALAPIVVLLGLALAKN